MSDPQHRAPESCVPWYRRSLWHLSGVPKIALVFAILIVCMVALRWGVAIGDSVGRDHYATYCQVQ